MFKPEGLKYLLGQLRSCDHNGQNLIIQEIKSKMNLLSSEELKMLLEFMNAISDIELEVKLFSLLAVCLASNDTYYETIVTHNPLYDKIEAILSRALPLKSTPILNFLSTLLFADDIEDNFSKQKKLAMHAQNMVRVSGCLSAMTTLFVNRMMLLDLFDINFNMIPPCIPEKNGPDRDRRKVLEFPDTWKALCQCLAECCRDCQLNKIHCANLIPLCIQKCLQGLTDVITTLHAILSDYSKNVQIFLNCNGITIFNRELLQYVACLQLLCTVLQSSKEAATLIVKTSVPEYITDILHWNGPHSQKGQWCTIAIYYLNVCKEQGAEEVKIPAEKDTSDRSDEISKNIVNCKPENSIEVRVNISNTHSVQNDTEVDQVTERDKDCNDDTTKLFRNVIKEVLFWKSKDEANTRLKPFMNAFTTRLQPEIKTKLKPEIDLPREVSTLFAKKENPMLSKMRKNNITNLDRNVKKSKKDEIHKNISSKATSNDSTNLNMKGFISTEIQRNNSLGGGLPKFSSQNKIAFSEFNSNDKHSNRFLNSENLSIKRHEGSCSQFSVLHSTKENPKLYKRDDLNIPEHFSYRREANQIVIDNDHELSFSFLQEQESEVMRQKSNVHCKPQQSSGHRLSGFSKDNTRNGDVFRTKQISDKSVQTNVGATSTCMASFLNNTIDDKISKISEEFKPIVMSTPKRRDMSSQKKANAKRQAYSYKESKLRERRRAVKKNLRKSSSPVKQLTNKSMSARFLSVLNESCTSFVKTVKDVFMPWKNSTTTHSNESTKTNKKVASSKYSFMEYMKKRDAILGNDSFEDGHSCNMDNFSGDMIEGNACKTCNDTAMLKHKLASNEYLRKTVKKLKLGINLYGCDFKKISRTFWARESYMTPTVLYGLYRKLIVK